MMTIQKRNDELENSRQVARIKFGIALMLVAFGIQIFGRIPEYWPLTRWAMYARASALVTQLDSYEVAVTDTTGSIHRLTLDDLGFLGRNILLDAFGAPDPLTRDTYRLFLIDRVQTALPGVGITSIRGFHVVWSVEPDVFPPIDLNRPLKRTSLGAFPVSFYTESPASPDADADWLFGDSLALLAFRVSGAHEVRQCEQLYVRTWWEASAQPQADYHITLVLADQTGIGRAQSDSLLAYRFTSEWDPGQQILDRRSIPIPCDLPPGAYNLLVGLYELATVQNVPVFYPDGNFSGQLAYLTTLEVKTAGES